MSMDIVLLRARLRQSEDLWDIEVKDGRVAAIVKSGTHQHRVAETHDIGGRILLPGFVDVHVHLDKAFQLPYLDVSASGHTGIQEALRTTADLRASMSLDTIVENADRTLRLMVNGGTVAARVHVEISAESDPAMVGVHRELAKAHPEIHLELAAFAQHGTTSCPEIHARMVRALNEGCSVVAGCPYADSDPIRHLDEMIALAIEYDAPLDLHLDLSDDPEDLMLAEVVPRVEKAGLEGRVLIGHVTALTAVSPERVKELVAAASGAGISVVAIPTTDLFLSGRDQLSAPTRGVTRIEEFAAAGVPVALASNNYENAFTPVSMPCLSQAAWLASLTNYMATADQQLTLLDGVTNIPRRVIQSAVPGLAIGDLIGASVFDVDQAVDVVRSAARPIELISAHRGVSVPDTFIRSNQEEHYGR
ncbi:amidohydrolase family protein [Gordonia sp. DT219]|uniref:amidohydrolase family protein n=1 Tax=Gordonia sp. DT219 TaxID=3416658 RepID=UPI003CE6F324